MEAKLINQYTIFPVGDSALALYLGNDISVPDNKKVIAMQQWLQRNQPEGVKDIIIAYSSITILYDPYLVRKKYKPGGTVMEFMSKVLSEAYEQSSSVEKDTIIKRIPVCYDVSFAPDIGFVAEQKNISIEDVVRLHTSEVYRVYMIGFLPGFPYMASVPEKIMVPRKLKPRRIIAAGSVGIAGKQTGIYPLSSPGGWQIIGRTPFRLFDKNKAGRLIIKTGDLVKFYAVNMREFVRLSAPST